MSHVSSGLSAVALRRVLVVNEDLSVGGLVRYALGQDRGTDVEVVGTTNAALDYIRDVAPELVVVDVTRSKEAKLDLCRVIRSTPVIADLPIIVTGARLSEADRALALDLGADDCLTRPFGVQEFAARARAVVRRRASRVDSPTLYTGDRLVADFARVSVQVEGRPVQLTRREFLILEYLIQSKNRVVSRQQLVDRLWPDDRVVSERTVDVHVGRLRAKLGSAASQVETVFGIGYRFVG